MPDLQGFQNLVGHVVVFFLDPDPFFSNVSALQADGLRVVLNPGAMLRAKTIRSLQPQSLLNFFYEFLELEGA
mgnify:CR=1 FL=1